jgi:hypothetical protein
VLAQMMSNTNGAAIQADPHSIPFGENNKLISNISFEFGQDDYKLAHIWFTDAENDRFDIPEDLVKKPKASKKMRIGMSGQV